MRRAAQAEGAGPVQEEVEEEGGSFREWLRLLGSVGVGGVLPHLWDIASGGARCSRGRSWGGVERDKKKRTKK